jgi:hypothetical protein
MTHVVVFLAMKTCEHNNNKKTKKMMTCGYEDLSTQEEEEN